MLSLSLSIAISCHRTRAFVIPLSLYIHFQISIPYFHPCYHRASSAPPNMDHRASSAPPNMEKPSPQEHDHAHALDDEDRGQKCRQLKGIRLRKWGSWVSEIRIPRSREKLWLGSYPTAQQAARAYDVAVYCLRGSAAKFNFPNSVPDIPSASSLSRREIQLAAAKYALDKLPSSPPSLQENDENNNIKASEEAASSSRSASVSETELWSDSHQILEEPELDLRECGSDGNYGCLALNLERMPSIDDALALELIPSTWQEEEHMDMFVDPTELWNF